MLGRVIVRIHKLVNLQGQTIAMTSDENEHNQHEDHGRFLPSFLEVMGVGSTALPDTQTPNVINAIEGIALYRGSSLISLMGVAQTFPKEASPHHRSSLLSKKSR